MTINNDNQYNPIKTFDSFNEKANNLAASNEQQQSVNRTAEDISVQVEQLKLNYQEDFNNSWDQNGDGSIDTDEMVALGWDENAWNTQVSKHDQDGDGKLNFDESVELWKEYDKDQDGLINGDEGNKMLFVDNQFGIELVESREENGLVVGGKLENGLEFERYNMVDNDNYTQVNSDNTMFTIKDGELVSNYKLENGLIVSGEENGLKFERYDMKDNDNYKQFNNDGTIFEVKDGEVINWASDFNANDLRNQHLEDIQINDLNIVDPEGEKFNRMMDAFNVTNIEEVTINSPDPNSYKGTEETNLELKASIVEMFLLVYGNDDEFLDAIEDKGINLTIANEVHGENSNGAHFGIGGFYSSRLNNEGRQTIVSREDLLKGPLIIHEFAHMRDNMLDGTTDGNFDDIAPMYHFDQVMEISREKILNEGAAVGLFSAEYSQTNDKEFLAEMMEGYYKDPILFEERFPEFAEMLGDTFDHLDQTIGLISHNDEKNQEIFDIWQKDLENEPRTIET
ncbi:MAG: zinc-dependent peptidase [Candidatus Caenarcaniphilales bacterium]|nr:zinc-dependent peptidase [Candidatus Caenarcaniphilales bacterium]